MTRRPRIVRALRPGRVEGFFFRGDLRELVDPDGLPTGRQLRKLNELGVLAVVEPGQVEPVTKGEAAFAIDAALTDEAA